MSPDLRIAHGSARAASAAIREIEPDLPMRIRLMQNLIDEVSAENLGLRLADSAARNLATILSAADIYGAVSFAVNQSTWEYGIRAALGAPLFGIVRSVLSTGRRPVVHGLLVGLWLSVATAAALNRRSTPALWRIDRQCPASLYRGCFVQRARQQRRQCLSQLKRCANFDARDAWPQHGVQHSHRCRTLLSSIGYCGALL